jgi:hypothetical protein
LCITAKDIGKSDELFSFTFDYSFFSKLVSLLSDLQKKTDIPCANINYKLTKYKYFQIKRRF